MAAESVVLTKSVGGDFQIVIGGQFSYTKQFPSANYSTNKYGIILNPPCGCPELMFKHYPPEAWTVGGSTGFTTNKQVTDALTAVGIKRQESGIATREEAAVLSDTVDLLNYGWIQPTLLAGTIKYTTEAGNVTTRDFDLKEVSLVRVRRIWLTGTTANMGIVVYS